MGLPDGRLEHIAITIRFGPDYPTKPPTVFDADRRWDPDDDRHIPEGHSFCLYLRDVDEPDLTRPEALSEFMLDVICFLDQQLIYDHIGRFAGPFWSHQAAGYGQYLLEQIDRIGGAPEIVWGAVTSGLERNDRCPCGSGRKAKRCHLEDISALRKTATKIDCSHLDVPGLLCLASET